MKRCPECLSTVEPSEEICPQCGTSFAPSDRRSTWRIATLLVVILAGLGGWQFLRGRPGPTQREAKEVGQTPRSPVTMSLAGALAVHPEASSPPEPRPGPRPTVHLIGEQGKVIFGLAIAGASELIFLPLENLPLRGELRSPAADLRIEVATYNQGQGFALLTTQDPLPPGVKPLALGDMGSLTAGTTLQGIDSSGEVLPPVKVLARGAAGALSLASQPPRGSTLLDPEGGAVAYSLGGGAALSLEGLVPWIGFRGGRPLAKVQAELRAQDPALVLEEAGRLLHEGKNRSALDALRAGITLARDRQTILTYEALERRTLQALLRELAAEDPVAAIALAREALVSYPDHYPLLADAVQIMVMRGDPLEAIGLYQQLQAGAPERAKATAQILTKGLQTRGKQLIAARRYREGLDLLARANLILPGRADLIMSYAEALSHAGRYLEARAAAEQAANLDPTYQRLLAGYRKRSATPTRHTQVEIPFDPKTNVIRTEVRIGGLPLDLIVDTGATMTIVPTELAQRLGLIKRQNRHVRVQTASGMAEGVMVRLPDLRIGELRLKHLRAIALDLPNSMSGRGLLGMNALRRLHLRMDSDAGLLILEKKR